MDERTELQPANVPNDLSPGSNERLPYIPCSVCLHEIPPSAAVSAEASDYVAYFCGLECFDQWRRRPVAYDYTERRAGALATVDDRERFRMPDQLAFICLVLRMGSVQPGRMK